EFLTPAYFVDELSRYADPRSPPHDAGDAINGGSEVELAARLRHTGKLPVVRAPVRQGGPQFLDAKRGRRARQPAYRVGRSNQPVRPGRDDRGNQPGQPLLEDLLPRRRRELALEERNPIRIAGLGSQ